MLTSIFETLVRRYPILAPSIQDVRDAFSLLEARLAAGGKLLVCGNGGSAADSEHIVGELLKGFRSRRPLAEEQIQRFESLFPGEGAGLAGQLQGSLPAISLVSPVSITTAVSNDIHGDLIFAQQVFGLAQPGDVLLAISTSGNARNVVNAAMVAQEKGAVVVALSGRSGGRLKTLADVAICVASDEVSEIQELHLPVYHALCAALEDHFFAERVGSPLASPLSAQLAQHPAKELPADIKLVVFDFDGVFTDNRVYTDQNGCETVACDRRDGLGVHMLREAQVPMMILSMEANPVVEARAQKLRIPVQQACLNKWEFLKSYLRERSIAPAEVVYVGNDVNDLECIREVGYGICPSDSDPAVLGAAWHILLNRGGSGAVREVCELILSKKTTEVFSCPV